jgi:beta-phosphoglucomutase-like phosphatase (HAD superfamily)
MIAVQWVLVLRALPDFERYKPIPHAARAVLELEARPSAVGTYRIAAPSLVYYLRRHVDEMFTDDDLAAFFATHLDGVCVMPAGEYERVRATLPVPTRVVTRGPRFDVRLTDVLSRRPLPEVVLVAADRLPPAR